MRLPMHRPTEEIPTSSMADIAFLLVIFFMITMTFAATQGLDLGLPEEEEGTEIEPVHSVLVEVNADTSLIVDSHPLALSDLIAYVGKQVAENPRKPVIVKTDPEAPYWAMVSVLDELRQAKGRLGLAEDLVIAVPTRREIAALWQ